MRIETKLGAFGAIVVALELQTSRMHGCCHQLHCVRDFIKVTLGTIMCGPKNITQIEKDVTTGRWDKQTAIRAINRYRLSPNFSSERNVLNTIMLLLTCNKILESSHCNNNSFCDNCATLIVQKPQFWLFYVCIELDFGMHA